MRLLKSIGATILVILGLFIFLWAVGSIPPFLLLPIIAVVFGSSVFAVITLLFYGIFWGDIDGN